MFSKSEDSKTITVTETAWGSTYSITTRNVGKKHQRIVIGFENGKLHESTKVYTAEESEEAIAWLMNYTIDNNLYPILNKFRLYEPTSPF